MRCLPPCFRRAAFAEERSCRGTLRAENNRVIGSIQVVENSGGVVIARNTVNGNLDCKENEPAPTGGGNRVGGSKTDQCEPL